jgi:mevalonate kinase
MPEILGAKISGSGLGDSVLALGKADDKATFMQPTPVELSEEGVRIHE